MHSLISLAAPVLLPSATVLRPRFGQVPVVLLVLCLLWVLLMRAALPGFGRRATLVSLLLTGLLIGSWLPRIAARSWGGALLTPAYYKYMILPGTVVQITVLLSLLSAPLWFWLGRWMRRRHAAVEAPAAVVAPEAPAAAVAPMAAAPVPAATGVTRRQLLGAIPWAGPGAALVLSGYGVGVGAQRLVVRRVLVTVPGLPPELRGLRLGQITDTHIATDLTPIGKLERGCELLARERLDLLLPTGDLCDNPRQLQDVLALLSQVPARLGRYACLGNHELFLGIPKVRRAFERSGVHLLMDESERHGALTMAGISYPHSGTPRLNHAMVPGLLEQALSRRAPGTFTVMLSHHPHVIKHAAGRGIGLMLSGHTHGGQLGLGERSPVEPFYGYVRGLYSQAEAGGDTQLFVSSGLGHWLPWRINCPPEVVVIELA